MNRIDRLEKLYEENRSRMYAEAFCLLKSQPDAEDAIHNVFLVLCRNPAIGDKILSLSEDKQISYLVVAVRNQARNILHRRGRSDFSFDEAVKDPLTPVDNDTPEDTVVNRLTVKEALSRLPERSQTALILYYGAGLSSAEVGKVLGIKGSSARKLINRTIKYLNRIMQDW